jgi:hypothetical protein
MPPDANENAIPRDAGLLRRIHPEQIIGRNTGLPRPSSAAFKDPNLSVDVEPLLHAAGLDWRFSLRDHPGFSLIRFSRQSALDQGLDVVPKPLTDNPAHAVVVGKKTQGKANALRDASEWVFLADPEVGTERD